ncbi:MAG: hypothetical protein ACM3H8_08755 [Sphingobacteriales bacterium]
MKKLFLFFVLISGSLLAKSQTADEVINKHIEALGGKEKLNSIKTLHMEGVIIGQGGNEITINVWKEHNKLYRREINFGMGTGIQLITDKGGWNTDRQGAFNPMAADLYHRQAYQMDCAGSLVDYAAKGHKAELLGKETINGKEFYKIQLSLSGGHEQTYFIDASTYYIDHITFKAGKMGGPGANPDAEITINYSNYTKTADGYIFPFTTTTSGGFGGSLNYETIEVNKPIDEKLYKAG